MITDLIKESIFYLALVSNGFCSCVLYIVTDFPGFDHFFYQITRFADMLRYFIQYLFLIGVG